MPHDTENNARIASIAKLDTTSEPPKISPYRWEKTRSKEFCLPQNIDGGIQLRQEVELNSGRMRSSVQARGEALHHCIPCKWDVGDAVPGHCQKL